MSARCENCEAVMVNGVYCHEKGCPSGYQGKLKERYDNYAACADDLGEDVISFDEWLNT